MIIAGNSQPKSHIMHCPKNYLWFSYWSMRCKTRMGYILKENKIGFKYIVSRNDIQLQTVHKRIFKTRINLANQDILHRHSVHGFMFLWFIERNQRLKYGTVSAKYIHKLRGCPIWNPPSWCSSAYSDHRLWWIQRWTRWNLSLATSSRDK